MSKKAVETSQTADARKVEKDPNPNREMRKDSQPAVDNSTVHNINEKCEVGISVPACDTSGETSVDLGRVDKEKRNNPEVALRGAEEEKDERGNDTAADLAQVDERKSSKIGMNVPVEKTEQRAAHSRLAGEADSTEITVLIQAHDRKNLNVDGAIPLATLETGKADLAGPSIEKGSDKVAKPVAAAEVGGQGDAETEPVDHQTTDEALVTPHLGEKKDQLLEGAAHGSKNHCHGACSSAAVQDKKTGKVEVDTLVEEMDGDETSHVASAHNKASNRVGGAAPVDEENKKAVNDLDHVGPKNNHKGKAAKFSKEENKKADEAAAAVEKDDFKAARHDSVADETVAAADSVPVVDKSDVNVKDVANSDKKNRGDSDSETSVSKSTSSEAFSSVVDFRLGTEVDETELNSGEWICSSAKQQSKKKSISRSHQAAQGPSWLQRAVMTAPRYTNYLCKLPQNAKIDPTSRKLGQADELPVASMGISSQTSGTWGTAKDMPSSEKNQALPSARDKKSLFKTISFLKSNTASSSAKTGTFAVVVQFTSEQ